MSEQRIGYFIRNGKQYQILSHSTKVNATDRGPGQIFMSGAMPATDSVDNLITMNESSMPPQLYRYNRFVFGHCFRFIGQRLHTGAGNC
jgi:multidrug efflux pump